MSTSIGAGRRSRRSIVLATVLAAALGVAGCSGSSSGAGAGGQSHTSGGSGGAGADAAAALKRVSAVRAVPTKLDPALAPLKARPQTGKKLVFLRCDAPDCKTIEDAARAGAKALGWTMSTIPYNTANPATLLSAMDQALQSKPDGVFVVGLPYEVWAGKVAAYRAAGVPIVAMFGGPNVKFDDTVVANVSEAFGKAAHRSLADWIMADSGGTARTLVVNTPELGSLGPITKVIQDRYMQYCKGCSTVKLDLTLAQVGAGKVVPAIVSALQRDPKIDYVQVVNGPFANGLGAALAAAGLKGKVKIVEGNPDSTGLADVRTGSVAAAAALGKRISGWLGMDAFARHFDGSTIPNGGVDGNLPVQVLDQKNISASDLTSQGDVPSDYPALFTALWKA